MMLLSRQITFDNNTKAVNSEETNELVLLYIQKQLTYQCSAMLKVLLMLIINNNDMLNV